MAEDRIVFRAPRAADTLALGRALGVALGPWVAEGFVVDLRGDLGAGKTVFVRGVAAGLGLAPGESVASPTFTLARDHAVEGGRLAHLDAYRLDGAEEFFAAGLDECLGAGQVTCVEWGERVTEALPAERLEVALEPEEGECEEPGDPNGPQGPRRLEARAHGARARAVLARWRALAEPRAATP